MSGLFAHRSNHARCSATLAKGAPTGAGEKMSTVSGLADVRGSAST